MNFLTFSFIFNCKVRRYFLAPARRLAFACCISHVLSTIARANRDVRVGRTNQEELEEGRARLLAVDAAMEAVPAEWRER